MTESNKWLLVTLFAVIWYVFYLLMPILTPFILATLLAYLGDPVVDRLEVHGLPRTAAVILVFVLLFSIVAILPFIIVPLIESQITALIEKLPRYVEWIHTHIIPTLNQSLHVDTQLLDGDQIKRVISENWRQFGSIATRVYAALSQSSLVVIGWVVNLALVPVVTFYLLRDWDRLVAKVHGLLPRRIEPTVATIVNQSNEVLGSFLRGQLLVMLALGTIYSIGLWIVGLDLAFLIGLVAGLVSFVPYLGFIVGVILAGAATIMQFNELIYLLWVALVFGIGQALEGMLLTPLLVGDKIGLHPVAVIFSVMAGGQLFGFTGVLLALPVAAVIMVLLRYFYKYYRQSQLYTSPSSDNQAD